MRGVLADAPNMAPLPAQKPERPESRHADIQGNEANILTRRRFYDFAALPDKNS
jgi:hypothetical protein